MDEADDGPDSDRDESAATPDAGEPFDAPGAAESPSDGPDGSGSDRPTDGRPVDGEHGDGLSEEIRELRDELAALEDSVEDRTVHRSEVEADLRRYVRRRLRRGHARGWGPYLVLLYGTAMTLGAFYMLSSAWAILAMLVIWLSTLGLYVLMVLVGVGIGLLHVPGKALDFVRSKR